MPEGLAVVARVDASPEPVGIARDLTGHHERLHDVVVYDDRVVLVPMKGANPETVGGILGLLAGGLVGSGAGRAIGRRVIRRRAQRRDGDAVLEAPSPHPIEIPSVAVRSVEVRERVDGAVVGIESDGGTTWLRQRHAVSSGDDIVALARRITPHVVFRPVTRAGRVAYHAGRWVTAVVALAMLAGIGFAAWAAAESDSDPLEGTAGPAVASATKACAPWLALAATESPTQAQLADAVAQAAPHMQRAAAADRRFADAADALGFLQAVLSLPPQLAAAQDQQRVATAGGTVDVTCALVG